MRKLLIVLCLFLLKISEGNEAAVPFGPVDRWYEVYLGEAKVGYAHDRMVLQRERVISQNEFVMKLNRAGQTSKFARLSKRSKSQMGNWLSSPRK